MNYVPSEEEEEERLSLQIMEERNNQKLVMKECEAI